MKLTVELVPSTCWYVNVRSSVGQSKWNQIRKEVYKLAGYKCEVCGGVGSTWPVEAHEIFEYDDQNHVQTLTRIIALCPKCHEVKHLGRAMSCGNLDAAKEHLANVNEWTVKEADDYVAEQFDVWRERSKHNWTLDLTILEDK
jgi:hypothetical protein